MPRRSAARVIWRSSATATKYRRCRNSICSTYQNRACHILDNWQLRAYALSGTKAALKAGAAEHRSRPASPPPESGQPGAIAMATEAKLLIVQFLDWVAARPRRYAEIREAWSSTCPLNCAWEDAVAEGLVHHAADGHVVLTARGRAGLPQPIGAAR